MSKPASPKSQGSTQQRASSAPANPDDPELRQDASLSEGDGLILGLGSGSPDVSPTNQRQALIAAATAGDAIAQCRMGDFCRTGDELTAQDFSEALRWYRLSAAQGDPNARNNLGAMFEHGMGVSEDMAEAAKWYTLAATQDLAIGQYNLGVMLLYGNGVRQDEQEAATWLHKAALQGHIQALSELGGMHLFGRGVERRIAIAAEMLTVAALDGDMNALGTLADYHGEIEQEALSGSLLSALSLAKMYDRGLGVERSKIKMLAWLMFGMKYGIRNGDADVREELGDMREFYSLVMAPTDKVAAKKLVKQMVALVAGTKGTTRRKSVPSRPKSPPRSAGGD